MTSHIVFAHAVNLLHSPQSNSKSRSDAINIPRRDMEATMHKQSYHTPVCLESGRSHRADALGFFVLPMGGVA